MNNLYIKYIQSNLNIQDWQVQNCIELLAQDATVPFISRYRKERTGALDEVQVSEIKHLYNKFLELDKRKESVINSIQEQDKLTPELEKSIKECVELQTLEDLYLPYKPKRRTRSTIAKERGLEPLAEKIYSLKLIDCLIEAEKFLNDDVATIEDAVSGARDIIAEWISENINIRNGIRNEVLKYGNISSKLSQKAKAEDSSKYQNYFEFNGKLNKIPAHRILAILRGFNEGHLSYKIETEDNFCLEIIENQIYKRGISISDSTYQQIDIAIEDSYKRLIYPSIENEVIKLIKERADIESVRVFGENLTSLLLAPPLGQKRVLAIDPGFRTGCKVVCLSELGELLHNDTIYPHPPVNEKTLAIKKISTLVESYKIEVIAIGDGTASRETESFIKRIALPEGIKVFSVSEDGASVYSASPVAREEFPQYDVTVRGAVSIGRRVMDPLAELVKIDPKSIGVGQYQHDVDQALLKEMLDNTVVKCVNKVGVNLNTASKHLLSYVSGIGESTAHNILKYRSDNGPFKNRHELLKIKRFGDKTFEQSAGFLRITNSINPLDNSSVHPERYDLVNKIANDLGCSINELIGNDELISKIEIKKYISKDVGEPTLLDIISELSKPGRDPRSDVSTIEFNQEISNIEDLRVGMILPGIVTNITNFGAFVDIGIKEDGLVHISQISKNFISSPNEVLKLQQSVKVKITEVDTIRKRIQLSIREAEE